MHCLRQKEDIMYRKMVDESVLHNKLILKSPIIKLALFSLDILRRIHWKLSRTLMSGGLYILLNFFY